MVYYALLALIALLTLIAWLQFRQAAAIEREFDALSLRVWNIELARDTAAVERQQQRPARVEGACSPGRDALRERMRIRGLA